MRSSTWVLKKFPDMLSSLAGCFNLSCAPPLAKLKWNDVEGQEILYSTALSSSYTLSCWKFVPLSLNHMRACVAAGYCSSHADYMLPCILRRRLDKRNQQSQPNTITASPFHGGNHTGRFHRFSVYNQNYTFTLIRLRPYFWSKSFLCLF